MRHFTACWLLAFAPAAALTSATTARAAEARSLTAPVGSTKGSVVLPYLEHENVTARRP
jgi:hypothetical protein